MSPKTISSGDEVAFAKGAEGCTTFRPNSTTGPALMPNDTGPVEWIAPTAA